MVLHLGQLNYGVVGDMQRVVGLWRVWRFAFVRWAGEGGERRESESERERWEDRVRRLHVVVLVANIVLGTDSRFNSSMAVIEIVKVFCRMESFWTEELTMLGRTTKMNRIAFLLSTHRNKS